MSKRFLSAIGTISLAFTALAATVEVGTHTAHTSIQAVLEIASTEDTTIRLMSDCTEAITIAAGQTITLDLNGQALRCPNARDTATLTNKGSLTITDSGSSGTIYGNEEGTSTSVVSNESGATLSFQSGIITTTRSSVNGISGDGKTTMTGGTITATANGISGSGEVNVSGGVITGSTNVGINTVGASCTISGTAVVIGGKAGIQSEDSAVTLHGGTVEGALDGIVSTGSAPTLTITNGTVTSPLRAFQCMAGTAEISGGLIAGAFSIGDSATLTLTGGLYDRDPYAYLSATTAATQEGPNSSAAYPWEVLPAKVLRSTNEGGFYTFNEALARIGANETLSLVEDLKDAEAQRSHPFAEVTIATPLTLNGNGHTLTVSTPYRLTKDLTLQNITVQSSNPAMNPRLTIGEALTLSVAGSATLSDGLVIAEGKTLTLAGDGALTVRRQAPTEPVLTGNGSLRLPTTFPLALVGSVRCNNLTLTGAHDTWVEDGTSFTAAITIGPEAAPTALHNHFPSIYCEYEQAEIPSSGIVAVAATRHPEAGNLCTMVAPEDYPVQWDAENRSGTLNVEAALNLPEGTHLAYPPNAPETLRDVAVGVVHNHTLTLLDTTLSPVSNTGTPIDKRITTKTALALNERPTVDAAEVDAVMELLNGAYTLEDEGTVLAYAYDFGLSNIKMAYKTFNPGTAEEETVPVVSELTIRLTQGEARTPFSGTLHKGVLELQRDGETVATIEAPTFSENGEYSHTWTSADKEQNLLITQTAHNFSVKLLAAAKTSEAATDLPLRYGDTIATADYGATDAATGKLKHWYLVKNETHTVASPLTIVHQAPDGSTLSTPEVASDPDYTHAEDVDIFFIYPTIWTRTEGTPLVCTIDDSTMQAKLPYVVEAQAKAFEGVGNLYVPYYPQLDAVWAVQEGLDKTEQYFEGEPYAHIVKAFEYYLEHYNNGRPFIIAGHSQGAAITKTLLKYYMQEHPEVYARMVAAYAIGYAVTERELAQYPHLSFAERADDTGVLVSWNTESPDVARATDGTAQPSTTNPLLPLDGGAISINPLSWTRTTEKAPVSQNLGARICTLDPAANTVRVVDYTAELLATKEGTKEDFNATVDTARGTILCDADVATYAPGALFPRGVFHMNDYGFYFKNITENAKARVKAYFNLPKSPAEAEVMGYTATDYTSSNHWIAFPDAQAEGAKSVAVFALYPTSWTREADEPYICPIDDPEMLAKGKAFIQGKISAFSEVADIYAPYYRQFDAGWLLQSESGTIMERERYAGGVPYMDVKAAFSAFLAEIGDTKPFILASHSQGTAVMKHLLKDVIAKREDLKARLIAAYTLGFYISDKDLQEMTLSFTEHATDLGRVISWNTEAATLGADTFNPLLPPTDAPNYATDYKPHVVNPLSWTNATRASPKITSPIANFATPTKEQLSVIGATIDADRGTLRTEADAEVFTVPGTEALFPKGVFHLYEYDFYYHNIAENARARIEAYFAH